jgi:hypothetical protein
LFQDVASRTEGLPDVRLTGRRRPHRPYRSDIRWGRPMATSLISTKLP